jgi:integrase
MADTRQWSKTATPGVFKQADTRGIERFRVIYQAREIVNGKAITRQRSQVFAAPKGKRLHRITVGADSRLVTAYDAARDFKAEQDAARKAGRTTDRVAADTTFSEFWPRYLERPTKRGDRRASTRATIDAMWRTHIEPSFGDRPIRSIKPDEIDTWFSGLTAGAAAKKKAASTLRAIINVAMKLGLADRNPVLVLDLPADGIRSIYREEVFSDEQIEKLKAAIDPRYRLMIDLLAEGLRIGEVVGLQRGDVNIRGDVTIRHNLVEVNAKMVPGPLKTEKSYRTLPLAFLRDAIQHHLAEYAQPEATGYVFTASGGTAPIHTNNWRKRAFYPALEAAGLPRITPHVLRHRTACDLLDRGFSVDQVADWLGDNAQTVRRVYANVLPTTKAQIAADRGKRYVEANGGK